MVNSILRIEDEKLSMRLFGFLFLLHGSEPTHRREFDGKEAQQEKQGKIHCLQNGPTPR